MRITLELIKKHDPCADGLADFTAWLGDRKYIFHTSLVTYINDASDDNERGSRAVDVDWLCRSVPGLIFVERFTCGCVHYIAHRTTKRPWSVYDCPNGVVAASLLFHEVLTGTIWE